MTSRYGTPETRYKDLSGIYDHLYPLDADGEASVAFLAKLAAGGRVLELGAGTGRVAIPLAEQGCTVTAVDASPDMISILKSKDPDGRVNAVLADMADPPVQGPFDLIYAVYNVLYELHVQDLQVACLSSAARLLRSGGALVIEASVANSLQATGAPEVSFSFEDLTTVGLQLTQYDQINQIAEYRHIFLGADGIKVMPSVHRYIYLSELDLMAALAGLEPSGRYSDWASTPLDAKSPRHVSVYTKPKSG
jgi:SAM-dependent methyltransferase